MLPKQAIVPIKRKSSWQLNTKFFRIEFINQPSGKWNHDPINKQESGRQPLNIRSRNIEVIHQGWKRQSSVMFDSILVQNVPISKTTTNKERLYGLPYISKGRLFVIFHTLFTKFFNSTIHFKTFPLICQPT